MTRSKYIQPPGPFLPEKPDEFSFSAEQWQVLVMQLPKPFRQLAVPPKLGSSNWSIADFIVQVTSEQIGVYFAAVKVIQAKGVTALTQPASVRYFEKFGKRSSHAAKDT